MSVTAMQGEVLVSKITVVHFDDKVGPCNDRDIVMTCDATNIGLKAMLGIAGSTRRMRNFAQKQPLDSVGQLDLHVAEQIKGLRCSTVGDVYEVLEANFKKEKENG